MTNNRTSGGRPILACVLSGLVFCLLSLIATALLYGFGYEPDKLLFKNGIAVKLYSVLVLLVALFGVAVLFLLRRAPGTDMEAAGKRSSTLQILMMVCGFAVLSTLIAEIACTLLGVTAGQFSIDGSILAVLTGRSRTLTVNGNIHLLLWILTVPAALFFILPGLMPRLSDTARALFGMAAALWALLFALGANLYTESFPMNSPLRLMPLLAGTATALFFTADVRFLVGRGRTNLLVAAGIPAMTACLIYALPELALTFAGYYELGIGSVYAIAFLCAGIVIIARLIGVAKAEQ